VKGEVKKWSVNQKAVQLSNAFREKEGKKCKRKGGAVFILRRGGVSGRGSTDPVKKGGGDRKKYLPGRGKKKKKAHDPELTKVGGGKAKYE